MNQEELMNKYDILGPRYTSYPPVPFWGESPSVEDWLDNLASYSPIDLYLHIPYCAEVCHYCGCNRQRLENESDKKNYLDGLFKEWQQYIQRLGNISVGHLHLGGGTPTILEASELSSLFGALKLGPIKGSLEADPRTTTRDKLSVLREFGFEKISFGVQDFDPQVQQGIGRDQSYDLVAQKVDLARRIGFQTVNFDLIFGLPGQNEQTIADTFKKVGILRPDTVAFYSFAYVPNFAANQKKINQNAIPSGVAKRRLYELGREQLESLGYLEIGMDHFALIDSPLYKSFEKKEITRSFMGYTVKGANALIGLGASAISSTPHYYLQNNKDIKQYLHSLEEGLFPFLKGHCLTSKEMEVSKWIQNVMCINEVALPNIQQYDFLDFIEDGLVAIEGNILKVQKPGRAFLRNICMRFDPIILNKVAVTTKFSRTI